MRWCHFRLHLPYLYTCATATTIRVYVRGPAKAGALIFRITSDIDKGILRTTNLRGRRESYKIHRRRRRREGGKKIRVRSSAECVRAAARGEMKRVLSPLIVAVTASFAVAAATSTDSTTLTTTTTTTSISSTSTTTAKVLEENAIEITTLWNGTLLENESDRVILRFTKSEQDELQVKR